MLSKRPYSVSYSGNSMYWKVMSMSMMMVAVTIVPCQFERHHIVPLRSLHLATLVAAMGGAPTSIVAVMTPTLPRAVESDRTFRGSWHGAALYWRG